ncbi:MAG: hypothetical protein ACHQII_06200 [Bacteroidia bacterium]
MQIDINAQVFDTIVLSLNSTIARYEEQKEGLTIGDCGDAVSLSDHYVKKIKENKAALEMLTKQHHNQHSL